MNPMSTLKIINEKNIPNIPWEDRPAGYTRPVWRYTKNPVIHAICCQLPTASLIVRWLSIKRNSPVCSVVMTPRAKCSSTGDSVLMA